jgi:hypothetical protein
MAAVISYQREPKTDVAAYGTFFLCTRHWSLSRE